MRQTDRQTDGWCHLCSSIAKRDKNGTNDRNLFKERFSFFLRRQRKACTAATAAAATGRRPRRPRCIANAITVISHVVHAIQVNFWKKHNLMTAEQNGFISVKCTRLAANRPLNNKKVCIQNDWLISSLIQCWHQQFHRTSISTAFKKRKFSILKSICGHQLLACFC